MTNRYQQLESDIKSREILSIVVLSVIVLLIITATILFIVFSTYFNRVLFTVLLCVIDSLLSVCLLLTYDFLFLSVIKTERHIKALMKEEEFETYGKLLNISEKPTTISDCVAYYKLTFESNGETKVYYYHFLLEKGFEEGKSYHLRIADNFILEIEESEND